MVLKTAALVFFASVAGAIELAAPGLGVPRLPAAPAAWTQVLRQAGVPRAGDPADAALVWGLSQAGVDVAKWNAQPESRAEFLTQARVQLSTRLRIEAANAAAAAQSLPDDASPQRLYAASDDLRYLTEAYGPNVPVGELKLEKLYEATLEAAQKKQAAALRETAKGIADILLAGAKRADAAVVQGSYLSAVERSPKDIPLTKPEKKWTFEERALAIRQAAVVKFPEGPRNRSVLDLSRETIDGIPYRDLNADGQMNAGVFEYWREGRLRIMKITTDRHTGFVTAEDVPEVDAQTQLRGGSVGSLFGAPALLRTGIIELNRGAWNYFLEMEKLFPGESARSFKTAEQRGDKSWIARLGVPRSDGRKPAEVIAGKIVEVLEHGVAPYDGDFLVTEDGRLRWIDTNMWAVDADASFPNELSKVLREANFFLRTTALDRAAGRAFALEFKKLLLGSNRIPEATKEAVLKSWIEHSAGVLEKLGLPTDYAALRGY